jgi:hypothetical protein
MNQLLKVLAVVAVEVLIETWKDSSNDKKKGRGKK